MREPGISHPDNYWELRGLAGHIPADEAIVEIGTFRGASAEFLALGSIHGKGAHVWTVDPHDLDGYRTTTGKGHARSPIHFSDPEHRLAAEERLTATERLRETVTMIQAFSTDAAAEWDGPPIGLLFIDGDHREGAVRRDFSAWEPHLAHGAIIAFDDHRQDRFPGVVQVVNNLVDKGIIVHESTVGTLTICRRVR